MSCHNTNKAWYVESRINELYGTAQKTVDEFVTEISCDETKKRYNEYEEEQNVAISDSVITELQYLEKSPYSICWESKCKKCDKNDKYSIWFYQLQDVHNQNLERLINKILTDINKNIVEEQKQKKEEEEQENLAIEEARRIGKRRPENKHSTYNDDRSDDDLYVYDDLDP